MVIASNCVIQATRARIGGRGERKRECAEGMERGGARVRVRAQSRSVHSNPYYLARSFISIKVLHHA